MSNAKLNKPPIFTGKDLSLATVNTWAIRAEDYVDDTPDEARKIKVAGSFLTETAELWYITTIRSRTPMLRHSLPRSKSISVVLMNPTSSVTNCNK
jgi:hypothetical protein